MAKKKIENKNKSKKRIFHPTLKPKSSPLMFRYLKKIETLNPDRFLFNTIRSLDNADNTKTVLRKQITSLHNFKTFYLLILLYIPNILHLKIIK